MKELHMDFIGLLAGICTTIAFIPQIIKIVKTRHVRDISLYMYIILTTGIFLWLIYGILLKRFPIMLANGVSLGLCLFVVGAKIRYKD